MTYSLCQLKGVCPSTYLAQWLPMSENHTPEFVPNGFRARFRAIARLTDGVRPHMMLISVFAFIDNLLEVGFLDIIARIALALGEGNDSIHLAGGLEFTSLVPIAGLVNETSCASFKDEFITPRTKKSPRRTIRRTHKFSD